MFYNAQSYFGKDMMLFISIILGISYDIAMKAIMTFPKILEGVYGKTFGNEGLLEKLISKWAMKKLGLSDMDMKDLQNSENSSNDD